MKSKIFLYIAGGIEIWYALFALTGSYSVWRELVRLKEENLPGFGINLTGLVILVVIALLLILAAMGLLSSQKWGFHLSSVISLGIVFLVVLGFVFSDGRSTNLPILIFNGSLPVLLIFSLMHPQTRRNIFPEKYKTYDPSSE